MATKQATRRRRSSSVSDTFIPCRARIFGGAHDMEWIPDDGGVRRSFKESRSCARLAQRCARCGTLKYFAISKITGEVLFTTMKYPEGYSQTGDDKMTIRQFRVDYLKKFG